MTEKTANTIAKVVYALLGIALVYGLFYLGRQF